MGLSLYVQCGIIEPRIGKLPQGIRFSFVMPHYDLRWKKLTPEWPLQVATIAGGLGIDQPTCPRSCKDCRKGPGEFFIKTRDPFRWRRVLYISFASTLRVLGILNERHLSIGLEYHKSTEGGNSKRRKERKSKSKMSDVWWETKKRTIRVCYNGEKNNCRSSPISRFELDLDLPKQPPIHRHWASLSPIP